MAAGPRDPGERPPGAAPRGLGREGRALNAAGHAGFGLALGGGFLRGLAHLGVLDALDEEGLRPGWLAGTSAGAIAAAFAAFGHSADETQEALQELGWSSMTKGWPFRRLGLATNQGLEDLLVDVLGEVDIGDAATPLAVVATDINTGDRVVLRRGPAARAVRASCCVPGLYEPVEMEGRLLVDGALTENVPARVVREMGAPVVVAVSLGFALPFQEVESWREVMANAWDIAANSQMRHEILSEADFLIDPDVDGFPAFRDRDREAIIEAGRVRAREAVPALRQLLGPEDEDHVVVRWMRSVGERLGAGGS